MKIAHLRANHLVNPLGFGLEPLTLSWQVASSTGKRAQAAQVEIAYDAEFHHVFHDSGRCALDPLGYAPGIELKPRTRYYWRVKVWADDGDCGVSDIAWFESGKMEEQWRGRWIEAPFHRNVHPVLARKFTLEGQVKAARLYAIGLGVYEAQINGLAVSDEVLAPFFNDYDLWLQSQTYDVTALLRQGENDLRFMLGNGWYKGRFGFIPDMDELYGDRMMLLCELRITLEDGRQVVLGSGEDFVCGAGPVLKSSIYDGEVYDAGREKGLSVSGFVPARPALKPPRAPVMDRLSPRVRVCERRKGASLIHTPAGEQVLDFGQVMTGWVEFECDLPQGAQVTLQYGELLQQGNFYNENLRTAKQAYRFISAGKPQLARPHFTFYGFRFVKVEGIREVDPARFTACVVHSDLERTGAVTTSNDKVNRLIENAYWGQIGNFLDVPTDCPQRDERMGWTGDAHVFANTASFNQYTPAFYHKYLTDMLLEQRTLGGSVPHVVPDVLDQIDRITGQPLAHHGACAWGDAAVFIPWTLYRFYGDKQLLLKHYENMRLWVDYVKGRDEQACGGKRLWTCDFHYADWLALDNPVAGSSFGGTDPYYVASAYYCHSAHVTALAAAELGLEEDARQYEQLSQEVRQAFQREYFTASGRVAEPTQTAMVLALWMDLAPQEHRARLIEDLKGKLKARENHLDTGFVGTYYLMRTLSRVGLGALAYTLLLNEDYPSWLYEVNMGATTIWERWNSVLPNGLVSDTGMNSMNHYAYGSVVEWIYRVMCGLSPDKPGFASATIAPQTDPRFHHAEARYDSASGRYRVCWRRGNEGCDYEVEVPFGAEATFIPERWTRALIVDGREAAVAPVKMAPGRHEIAAR